MANIHDVAQLAGVSIKTVSRVINDEPSIRDSTRAKVEAAIAKLKYRPHAGARSMRSSKSGIIGMITGVLSATTHDPLESGLSSMHLVRAVQEACQQDGRILMIADSPGSPEKVANLLQTFQSHRVEGVIYAADHHRQVLFPHSESFPLVLTNCFDAMHTPAVVPDDTQGQEIATRHLIEQGHRYLDYFGLPNNVVASRL
ncbi:MAG: LacI family DNA-binding transcriptional regulator, partial [Natronospirillum sp.]